MTTIDDIDQMIGTYAVLTNRAQWLAADFADLQRRVWAELIDKDDIVPADVRIAIGRLLQAAPHTNAVLPHMIVETARKLARKRREHMADVWRSFDELGYVDLTEAASAYRLNLNISVEHAKVELAAFVSRWQEDMLNAHLLDGNDHLRFVMALNVAADRVVAQVKPLAELTPTA